MHLILPRPPYPHFFYFGWDAECLVTPLTASALLCRGGWLDGSGGGGGAYATDLGQQHLQLPCNADMVYMANAEQTPPAAAVAEDPEEEQEEEGVLCTLCMYVYRSIVAVTRPDI